MAATHLALIRRLSFCAGHRLYGHEGRCAFLHGHNYRVDIEVEAEGGGAAVDAVGRVVDFSLIKKRMLGWLDEHWDHAFILFEEDATALAAVRAAWETDEACAVASRGAGPAAPPVPIAAAVCVDRRPT
ncbi:MAG: 6-carboxytetrahydropterin synthase [Planctomycetaceae bacterium]|nr:6-carboxytetrahydropterin synthase [Planctomycetaceae bacterium]